MTPLKLLSLVQSSNQLRRDLESIILDQSEPLTHDLHFSFYGAIAACKNLTAAIHAQSIQIDLFSSSSGTLGSSAPKQSKSADQLRLLVDQAWLTRCRINSTIEQSIKNCPSVRRERLNKLHRRAYSRFNRRQDAYFTETRWYQTGTDTDTAAPAAGAVAGSVFKSPHTITSGLLCHGDTNQSKIDSFSTPGLLSRGGTNHPQNDDSSYPVLLCNGCTNQ